MTHSTLATSQRNYWTPSDSLKSFLGAASRLICQYETLHLVMNERSLHFCERLNVWLMRHVTCSRCSQNHHSHVGLGISSRQIRVCFQNPCVMFIHCRSRHTPHADDPCHPLPAKRTAAALTLAVDFPHGVTAADLRLRTALQLMWVKALVAFARG